MINPRVQLFARPISSMEVGEFRATVGRCIYDARARRRSSLWINVFGFDFRQGLDQLQRSALSKLGLCPSGVGSVANGDEKRSLLGTVGAVRRAYFRRGR